MRSVFERKTPVVDVVNRKLLRDFRLYMLVGGMPQAVSAYLETNNLAEVYIVKRDIITLYEDDFRKIDGSGRMSIFYDAVPSELNKNASRYQVSSMIGDGVSKATVEQLTVEMKDSMMVNVA